jgi:hypothetical protein
MSDPDTIQQLYRQMYRDFAKINEEKKVTA